MSGSSGLGLRGGSASAGAGPPHIRSRTVGSKTCDTKPNFSELCEEGEEFEIEIRFLTPTPIHDLQKTPSL